MTPVWVDFGLEIPDYGQTVPAGLAHAGQNMEVALPELQPDQRYVVRLRADWDG